MQGSLKSYKKPLEDAGEEMLEVYSQKVFKTRGRAVGDSWKPLSAATLKLRSERRGYYSQPPKKQGQPLVWTGRLQEGFRKTVSKTRLVIDNTVDYFKFHQRSRGKPPQRKMLGLTKDIILIVMENIQKHVNKAIR